MAKQFTSKDAILAFTERLEQNSKQIISLEERINDFNSVVGKNNTLHKEANENGIPINISDFEKLANDFIMKFEEKLDETAEQKNIFISDLIAERKNHIKSIRNESDKNSKPMIILFFTSVGLAVLLTLFIYLFFDQRSQRMNTEQRNKELFNAVYDYNHFMDETKIKDAFNEWRKAQLEKERQQENNK